MSGSDNSTSQDQPTRVLSRTNTTMRQSRYGEIVDACRANGGPRARDNARWRGALINLLKTANYSAYKICVIYIVKTLFDDFVLKRRVY
jgi:hypothetical protein